MASRRETTRPGAFLVTEEPGAISRDSGYLAEGENLPAGTLLAENDDGDLVAWESGACAGILFAGTDARSARQQVAIISRLAVVNFELLAYGAAEEADARDALAAIRIEVLADHPIAATGGGGGGGYVAKAVHFDGATWLTCGSLSCADSSMFGFAGWLNSSTSNFGAAFVSDPDNNYVNFLSLGDPPLKFSLGDTTGNQTLDGISDAPLSAGWHSFIGAADTSRMPLTTNWDSVASSSDGIYLVAVVHNGNIWTSADSGATWTARKSGNWFAVASSADGAKLIAVEDGVGTGKIWTSIDYGATWVERTDAGVDDWQAVASSADGTKLVAVVSLDGAIWTSTDSGATWTKRTATDHNNWWRVASSANGSKLVAAAHDGSLWTSVDSGATWVERTGPGTKAWAAVASSADGAKLVAAESAGTVWTSTNSGATWVQASGIDALDWYVAASSDDGDKLALVATNGGTIWTSTNSGATWTEQSSAGSRGWTSIASSSDGAKLVACAGANKIWLSSNSGVDWSAVVSGKIIKLLVDQVSIDLSVTDTSNSFAVALNGLSLLVGNDGFDDFYIGDMVDFRIMPNTNLLDGSDEIPLETIRLFVDENGKPVDPAVATAALGTPAVLFSGGASSFATNQGTGGDFTLTGTLTNATTSPSD